MLTFALVPDIESPHPEPICPMDLSSLQAREHAVQDNERRLADWEHRLEQREADLKAREDVLKSDEAVSNKGYWESGMWIKSLVFGGLDGLTTTIALICSGSAAGTSLVSVPAIMLLGFATLLADGFSMGIGDYLSSLAEADVLNASNNSAESRSALKNGLVMFGSFVFFGGMPLLSYIPPLPLPPHKRFLSSCILCGICLFTLGSVKGKLDGTPVHKAGLTMLCLGSIASFLSYFVSNLIHGLM